MSEPASCAFIVVTTVGYADDETMIGKLSRAARGSRLFGVATVT